MTTSDYFDLAFKRNVGFGGGIQMLQSSTCSRTSWPSQYRSYSFLNNFSVAVPTHFEPLRRMDDLKEAITCHRQALALQPHGHPSRSHSLTTLATAVLNRFHGIYYYNYNLVERCKNIMLRDFVILFFDETKSNVAIP